MVTRPGIPRVWGADDDERQARLPCDDLCATPRDVWLRAVTVRANRATVFRWLCQLKIAPYSYDTLDNFGRRSPRTLTPGADDLRVGQPVMTIFELVDFTPQQHLTIQMRSSKGLRLFGEFFITYAVFDHPAGSRLVAKLLIDDSGGPLVALRRRALAWGDLAMMRRQLLTLRTLAERTESSAPS